MWLPLVVVSPSRRALNDDVNRVVGQLSVKDFEQPGGCLEFLLFRHRVEQNRKVVVVLVRNGDAPEGELVCIDVTEALVFSALMSFLRSSTVSFEGILIEKALDVASPLTRQNRLRRLSVMVLRSIKGKQSAEKKVGVVEKVWGVEKARSERNKKEKRMQGVGLKGKERRKAMDEERPWEWWQRR